MKDQYYYFATLKYDKNDIYVQFPDFPDCFTDGKSEIEAINNAQNILELWLYDMEQKGLQFPKPTPLENIKLDERSFMILLNISMPLIRDKIKNTYVKKTLTLPKWLDELGKIEKVNFSFLLQKAVKEYLGIEEGKNGI